MSTVTRASILARISVDTDTSDSVERQESELRQLATRLGAEVVAVHTDLGVSGAATRRPALDAWLADAAEGRADLLLAWDWSRISRTGLRSVARVLDVLESSGARLVTLRDNLDSSAPAFGIITAVMAETAKAEREAIAARTRSRQAADRARGVWTKPRPFGYNVKDGALVQHPTEAKVLRTMVRRYVDGDSLRGITRWLNDSGVPAPRGGAWGLSSVRHILYSPSSAGMIPHRDDVVRDETGAPVIVARTPVITLAEHRAVLDRTVVAPKSRGRKPAGERHTLSGKVRCACGAAMVHQSRTGSGRAPSFRCVGRAHGTGCTQGQVRAEILLEEVERRVLTRVTACEPDSAWLADVAVRLGYLSQPVSSAELDAARAEHDEVTARLAEAEDAYFAGRAFRGADGRARYERLSIDLADRLAALDAVLAVERPAVDLTVLTDPVLWQGADVTDLLRATVGRVTVSGTRVTVDWRG